MVIEEPEETIIELETTKEDEDFFFVIYDVTPSGIVEVKFSENFF